MKSKMLLKVMGIVVSVALIGSIFYVRALNEVASQKGAYTNFFVFWLAGDLILQGQSPYNPQQWLDGHAANGYDQPAEEIFLYPLPLAVLISPIGLFSLNQASLIWKILSQLLMAITIFLLLGQWQRPAHQRLFVPLVLICLYFGPVLLMQRSGSIGAMTLLIVTVSMLWIQMEKWEFASGFLLAFTMLKPPQGVLILSLFGIWLLARRNWKAILGIFAGGVVLWLIGAMVDPGWVTEFLHGGEAAFGRRLGLHSNVWSFSYLACGKDMACTYLLGGAGALILLGMVGLYLWKRQVRVTAWEAMNLILPISFVSTVYLWAYDQILYIIPIIWIVGTIVFKTKSYVQAFLFLIVLDVYAFFAMGKLSETSHDLWSLGNTLIVLTGIGIAYLLKEKPEKVKPV